MSTMQTPEAQQRRSYRQSYRRSTAAASHLSYTTSLTKRAHIISRRASRASNITEKVDPAQLALLMQREWQLSYVTPLYAFRHTQLRAYARHLSAFITAEKQRGTAVEVGPENNFNVSFSVVPGMAENDDAETVCIQILSKPPFAERDKPPRTVWCGWLTCVSGNPDYLRSIPAGFICLPLFCSSGTEQLTSLVKAWFQQSFDCSFGPLQLNAGYLHWLAALWTDFHPQANTRQLKLIWTLPVQPPLEVSYAVRGEDAWCLWSSLREGDGGAAEESEGSIGIEEVTRFIKALEGHFYRHFRLDLSAGRLKEVSTALGSAKHNGKIKVSSSCCLLTTLTLLTECALLKMPI